MEEYKSKNKQSKMVTQFGQRKISNQNFSKVIALPKTALENCGITEKLSVELVQEGENKFLKLSPVGGEPIE